MIRADFIFSYWIFAWYLLYIFGFETSFNPKFALICGLFVNLGAVCLMLYTHTKIKVIFLFIICFIIIKLIPIITIWNTKTTQLDIITTFQLLFIYLIWIYVNKIYIKRVFDVTFNNKIEGPLMSLLTKLLNIKV
jgi:hypothetical protein